MNPLERTAVHEAAHVVVARVFGLTATTVSVVPAPACAGATSLPGASEIRPAYRAVIIAAGDEAVRMALEHPGTYPTPRVRGRPRWLPEGVEGGRRTRDPVPENVEIPVERDRVERDAGGPRRAAVARRSARALLMADWQDVRALAGALLERGKLRGNQINDALARGPLRRGRGASSTRGGAVAGPTGMAGSVKGASSPLRAVRVLDRVSLRHDDPAALAG